MVDGVGNDRWAYVGAGRVGDVGWARPVGVVIAPPDQFPGAQDFFAAPRGVDVEHLILYRNTDVEVTVGVVLDNRPIAGIGAGAASYHGAIVGKLDGIVLLLGMEVGACGHQKSKGKDCFVHK